jgi:hypothetical protein
MRATRSVGPPGGKPCTMVMGRSGHSVLERAGAAIRVESPPTIAMRRVSLVIAFLPVYLVSERAIRPS